VSRTQERLALGAIVVGRVVNMLPIATENPDYRYVVQGAVFVAWGLAAVVLLAWRPRFGPVATVPAVSRATRRRGGR
jgi:hypothetical protein